eukprot:4522538-Pyramimonas_sp.AAC.1
MTLLMRDKIVLNWEEEKLGYDLGEEAGGRYLTHAPWADNILLLSKSKVELARMVGDFSAQLYTHGFRWKDSSLHYLALGEDSEGASTGNLVVHVNDHGTLCLPRCSEVECLGCLVTTKTDKHHDVAWKLAR